MNEHSNTLRRDLLWLTGLALLYRALFLLAMPRVLDTADSIHYIETANFFAAGGFFQHNPKIPILYPLLGALFHVGIPDMEWACRMVSFVASVLTVIPVYLLALAMHGRRSARIGALAVAIWPWLADYGCMVAPESVAMLWWFTGAWLIARAAQSGGWARWACVLPMIALYLTRPEGLFLLIAAPVFAMVLFRKQGPGIWRRFLPYAGLGLLAMALNTLYTHQLTGAVTANYRIGFILQEFDWARFVHTTVSTLTNVLPVMLGPLLLIFLAVGLFARRTPEVNRPTEGFLGAMAGLQWVVSLFVLSPAPRYLMAPIMALALWSARGMALTTARVPTRWVKIVPVGALVAVMLFQTVVTVGSEYVGRLPREPREYKTAGLWMREHLEPGLIFCRKPQVGYYAQMPSTGPDLADTLTQALDRARAAGARYVVVDERYTAQQTPGLKPLLNPGNAPESLTFLQQFDLYPGGRVVVYAIRNTP